MFNKVIFREVKFDSYHRKSTVSDLTTYSDPNFIPDRKDSIQYDGKKYTVIDRIFNINTSTVIIEMVFDNEMRGV